MKRRWILTIFGCLLSWAGILSAKDYDVRDFGAVGDGRHIDSPAINAALQKAAQDGKHAVVVVGEGTYLCYSLHLQSGVTLRLERGAVLKAAPPTATEGYDEAEENSSRYQDFGHSHWHNSLLWGEGLHDVVLEGEGLIDGSDVLTRGGLTLDDVAQQRNSNPFFFGGDGTAIISRHEARGYPEPSAHGIQPAWGVSVIHAEDIVLRNIRLQTLHADERPAVSLQHHRKVRFHNVKATNNGLSEEFGKNKK